MSLYHEPCKEFCSFDHGDVEPSDNKKSFGQFQKLNEEIQELKKAVVAIDIEIERMKNSQLQFEDSSVLKTALHQKMPLKKALLKLILRKMMI